MTFHRVTVLLLGLSLLTGCGGGESSPPATAPQPTVTETPAPLPPPPALAPKTPAPSTPVAAEPSATPAASKTVQTPAAAGVTGKGQYEISGPIVTPIAVYFSARERIPFEIELPKAMQLYKAMEGRAPATHEEFMEKVIKANMIKLPELPEGHHYKYDPKTEQLMVEKPAE